MDEEVGRLAASQGVKARIDEVRWEKKKGPGKEVELGEYSETTSTSKGTRLFRESLVHERGFP